MILLRVYLLAGLIVHKAIWEVLRRGARGVAHVEPTGHARRATLAKFVKLAILLGIVAQVFLPDVLPMGTDPVYFRWAGAAIYAVGWTIAVIGRLQLGRNWNDIEAEKVRREQALVTTGIYRRIRHPIYVGDLLLLLGLELALNSWLAMGVVVLAPVVLRQAVREEILLCEHLPGYREYCKTSKRFVPYLV